MQTWFSRAKFGIMMHWGIYAVEGTSESWAIYNGECSYEDYFAQAEGFTARNYNPEKWAELFSKAGARYTVLTAMHCDGMALWDTALTPRSVAAITPAGRDLLGAYCEAMRKKDMKVGLYYSHVDWSDDDYTLATLGLTQEQFSSKKKEAFSYRNIFNQRIQSGFYRDHKHTDEEAAAWRRFIRKHDAMINELLERFKPVDLLWFDFMYPREGDYQWGEFELVDRIRKDNPQIVLNSRIGKAGGYHTAEKGLPLIRPSMEWEYSETLGDAWGYRPIDQNFKSYRDLIRLLVECLSMGGNFLLNVGPMEDGTILPELENRLLEIGGWIRKHSEAVYDTQAGLLPGHFHGPTTVSPDKTSLYMYLYDIPRDNIVLKGIKNTINRITVVGFPDHELTHRSMGGASWAGIPGILLIEVPAELLDDCVTVLKVELDGELQVYRNQGVEIIDN